MDRPVQTHSDTLIEAYLNIGLSDLPDTQRSARFAFNLSTLLGGIVIPVWIIAYMVYDFDGLKPLWLAALIPVLLIFVPLIGRYSIRAALLFGASVTTTCFAAQTYFLGAASGMYLFILLSVLSLIILRSVTHPLQTALSVAGLVVVMVGCAIRFADPSGDLPPDPAFAQAVFVAVLLTLCANLAIVLFALNRKVAVAEAALAEQHARSEQLLRNLLPEQIAARLKARPGEVIADGFPEVTLLFADIVDFTPRSAQGTPEQVVAFLNRTFSEFDRLTAERGLEKIKTIGDAYMVAAGLPHARDDHAQVIADMALAMQDAAARLSRDMGEQVQLRIGIHSGPAIAGVIGTSKVFYDVWGDTVNTASRMESHGAPGRIQITAATRALLAGQYGITPRGQVDIKGVGRLDTFWLNAPVAAVG